MITLKVNDLSFGIINIIFYFEPKYPKCPDKVRLDAHQILIGSLIAIVDGFDFDMCKIFYKYNTNSIYVHVNNFKVYDHICKTIKFDNDPLNVVTRYKNGVSKDHWNDSNHTKLLRIVKYYLKGSFINKSNSIESYIRDKQFLN